MVQKVGIIGYGNLGKYLASKVLHDDNFELAFVWNRTKSKLSDLDSKFILDDINNFFITKPDIVVEVAHPSISKSYGEFILKYCDYMIGSPTALCDTSLLKSLQDAAVNHALYVPSGAFWGGEDIRKMAEAKRLQSLTVTMRKHPLSLKLEGHLKEKNMAVKDEAVILFQGPVQEICLLAPHNTNTMAVGAIAALNLGFGGVKGCLVSDPSLRNYHIVEIEAFGFPNEDGSRFHVHTIRRNPAVLGEVTGEATYAAYFGSLRRAECRGPGLHLC